jgi:hypothetical protein
VGFSVDAVLEKDSRLDGFEDEDEGFSDEPVLDDEEDLRSFEIECIFRDDGLVDVDLLGSDGAR